MGWMLKVHRRRMLAGAVAVMAGIGVWLRCMPVPAELLHGVDTPSTVVVDRHGRVLYEALSASVQVLFT